MSKKTANKVVKMDTKNSIESIPPNKFMHKFSVFDIQTDLESVDNKDIKKKHCGHIGNFDRYVKNYENSKSTFTVVSYGVTRKMIYSDYSFIFNGLRGSKKPLGTHLISLVKKDIDKCIERLELENKPLPKIPDKKPYLTFIHHKNLEFYGSGVEALAIDVNQCHWQTAFILGIITEDTYNKGMEKKEYKDGRLISIGTLGKVLTIKEYVDGVKIKEYIDDNDYIKYGGFYWMVISKVYALLVELWYTLKEDFLMFLTDCVVIDPSKKDLAESIIIKHGYSSKTFNLVFTEVSENSVRWVTDTGEPKGINHNKMLDKG